jgi:4-amino-4-deoxy-L-arabinose transferase-like glycosyltransferase
VAKAKSRQDVAPSGGSAAAATMDGALVPSGAAEVPARPKEADRSEGDRPAEWLTWLSAKLTTDRTALTWVLVLGALLFLPFLGALGLWDPWETHYGEVARAMIARDDFVYPYWESAYFFSKPALTLWLMAFGFLAVGAEGGAPTEPLGSLTEWGARIPFALIAIGTLWAVYSIAKQLRDRTTGVIAAFVLASSPQFIFIGKQAMADMPFVGFMTIGLALFMAAVFDESEDGPPAKHLRIMTATGVGLATFVQLFLIGREMEGANLAGVVAAAALALAFVGYIALYASRRDCWLAGFYTCMGLACLAKGLAPLYVVGPTVVLYIVFTLDWRILMRSRVIVGGVLFLLVAAPWYVTLSLFKGRDDEGLTFNDRFWIHDNFSRVGAGVHGDRGGAGYYFEQLIYGMFPWSGMIPFAVGHAAVKVHEDDLDLSQRARATLFVLTWAAWVYAGFTMSQTKFHHYIFPSVPALAVLIGVWFTWLAEEPATRVRRAVVFLILALFAVGARDLINEPQNLVNLFTYKYDRDYPRDIVVRPFLGGIIAIGMVAAAVAWFMRRKDRSLLAYLGMAGLLGAWISHHHFYHLAPHWSQAHLFQTYYGERKGNEPIYAYQLNWRGETFYSRNRVLQVKERGANERIRQLVDQPGREFIITEQSRFHQLKSALSPEKREKAEIVDRSSNKFYLIVVED